MQPKLRLPKLASAIVMAGVMCTMAAGAASAGSIFSDGFESGDFSAWSQVQVGADGKAVVQSAVVSTGALAAQLSETSTSGSKAYVRKTFSAAQQDLTATGDFRVLVQGSGSSGNVPFFRLFNPSNGRVVALYRQNGAVGSIGLTVGSTHLSTSGKLALNTWGTISLHAITNGASSTLEVRLDGTLIYSTTSVNLGTAGISTVQIGNDTAAQQFTIVADNISVSSGASSTPSPPVNTTPPSISGTPQDGQTLTANPGTWAGTQPISYAYEWQRCDASGGSCAAIATGPTYPVTSADVGKTMRVRVTATNSEGSAAATSSATTVVQSASAPPNNTAPPTISGTPQEGQVLNASTGTWSGTQPINYAYQWLRCDASGTGCGLISTATGAAYAVASADVGHTLMVAVTASNSVGSSVANSNPSAVVQASSKQPGLVALWHMDELSGTTMFDAVGSHNGVVNSTQLGVPGFAGTAYGFNGISSYVSVPDATDLDAGSANITITLHFNTTAVAPAPPSDWDLIRKGLYTTSGGEFKMEFQQSGKASCGFKGSSGYSELITGPAINNGQWHTVQCVKTSSAIKLVVDGTTFSQTANVGAIANAESVVIGARPGSEFFKGTLDEANIQIG